MDDDDDGTKVDVDPDDGEEVEGVVVVGEFSTLVVVVTVVLVVVDEVDGSSVVEVVVVEDVVSGTDTGNCSFTQEYPGLATSAKPTYDRGSESGVSILGPTNPSNPDFPAGIGMLSMTEKLC